jgi:hypothetical protein
MGSGKEHVPEAELAGFDLELIYDLGVRAPSACAGIELGFEYLVCGYTCFGVSGGN